MASWKKVLTEVDKSTSGVANDETGLVTGDQVFDYIAAQNFGTGSGDITAVVAGSGMTGGAVSGSATVNVIGGDGITANADNIVVAVDDATIELSASDGTGLVRAKTAAVVNGGTGLATGDQIYDFVIGLGYSTTDGTVTNVTSATTNQLTVASGTSTPALTVVTGAVTDGGTALATGDQIYDHVTSRINGLTSNTGTVTSVAVDGGTNLTDTGGPITGSGTITMNLDTGLTGMVSMSGVDIAGGVSNGAGGDLTFNGGVGTGTGIGGDIFFKVAAPAAGSGSTQNAVATAMTIAAPTTSGGDSVVTIAGDLVVNGTTSSVDVQTLTVEDKTILVADGAADNAAADGAGLIVDTAAGTTDRAHLQWNNSADGVTGWSIKEDGAVADFPAMGVAVMNKTASSGAPSATNMPTGSLFYVSNATGKGLYLYLD